MVIFQAPNLGYLDTDFEYTNLFEACFLNSTNGAYFYAIKHPDNSFYSKNRFTPYFQSLPIMYLDRQHNKLTLKYPLDNYIYEYSVNEPFVSPLSIKVESDQVQANLQDVPISSKKNSYKSSFKLPQYSTLNLSSSFTLLGFDLGQNQNNIQYLLIDNDTREIQFEFNRPEEWLFLDHVDMDGNIYVKPNLVELFNTEPDYSIFFIYRLKKGG